MDSGATTTEVALTLLRNAVSGVIAAVESGGLDGLEPGEKVTFWQAFEAERRRLPLVDHALVADAQESGLATHFAYGSLPMMLTKVVMLSPAEASARVHAAAAVGPRTSMLGQPLPAERPALAAAQRAGEVSTEQVGIIERTLRHLSPALDPAQVAQAEQTLTDQARVFGPKDLRLIASRLADALDPDGPEPDDTVAQQRRNLELRPLRDGMWRIEGRLTATAGAQLNALLGPLAKPQPLRIREDGRGYDDPDMRRSGQRWHDALEEAAARLLKAPDLPASGGSPTSVVVTLTLDDLLARTGLAQTADGALLTSDQLLRLAAEAEIWTAITDAHGVPLALGRTRRIATHGQSVALAARDGGCSFPGCSRPPAWCDRHHILDWIRGGRTDLSNLTLLCRYHHTHFAERGWTCRLNSAGLPEWTPPRWVDPQQRPLLHDRIRRRQVEHTLIA